jgi:hypothetical protein
LAASKLKSTLPWLSIAPLGLAVVPDVWITVARWSRSMAAMPSCQASLLAASMSARATTSSMVSASLGSLPLASKLMTCSIVGHSLRIDSILAACCAFSTKTTFAFTLLMTKAAWPASDCG